MVLKPSVPPQRGHPQLLPKKKHDGMVHQQGLSETKHIAKPVQTVLVQERSQKARNYSVFISSNNSTESFWFEIQPWAGNS